MQKQAKLDYAFGAPCLRFFDYKYSLDSLGNQIFRKLFPGNPVGHIAIPHYFPEITKKEACFPLVNICHTHQRFIQFLYIPAIQFDGYLVARK